MVILNRAAMNGYWPNPTVVRIVLTINQASGVIYQYYYKCVFCISCVYRVNLDRIFDKHAFRGSIFIIHGIRGCGTCSTVWHVVLLVRTLINAADDHCGYWF